MDVPYPGTVASLKKDGLSVRVRRARRDAAQRDAVRWHAMRGGDWSMGSIR
jgi:hypothetical protein